MPTFSLMLAQDVTVYGNVEIEADTFAEAIEMVTDHLNNPSRYDEPVWDEVHDPDYSAARAARIVTIENTDTGQERYNIQIEMDAPEASSDDAGEPAALARVSDT